MTGPPTGVKTGAKTPTNMAKTTEVLQKPDESNADVYKRLYESFLSLFFFFFLPFLGPLPWHMEVPTDLHQSHSNTGSELHL